MQSPHMNWNTDSFFMASPKEQVSASDLDALLKGRKFGQTVATDVNMCPPVEHFDPVALQELEEYCKKRGIVGVNFTGMNPTAVLKMLKQRVEGIYTKPTNKSILNG